MANPPTFERKERSPRQLEINSRVADIVKRTQPSATSKKIVAIASSTGGPRALQTVIASLPANLAAPVLIVQHMPKGFTLSLAERLNLASPLEVKEAREGEEIHNGTVYLAMGGQHMTVATQIHKRSTIHYTDEPYREGVRPCANYMYESLAQSGFEEVVCVVMTGMGADGTVGIEHLKTKKKVWVIAQNQESCVVYGMPKQIVDRHLSDQVVSLEQIAQEIILNVGVI
jgi:two-component system chemotaxis response regulator CheB